MAQDIGTMMKERREALGLTMADVASQVGVGRSTILRWESGEIRSIKRADIVLLSKSLYLPISAFFSGPIEETIEDSETAKKKIALINRVRDLSGDEEIDQVSTALDMVEYKRKHNKK